MTLLNLGVDTPNTVTLDRDVKTKDNWVKRDDRLIRLTGAHPFNCEAPLTELYDQGFITPHNLHFVRNHGPVAEADDEEIANWTIKVDGMVDNPIEIPLKDLQNSKNLTTLPVTLCCAGNRRGEQNMVRQSKGFTWGSAGVSTSFWTGMLLKDVIAMASPKKGAKYVVFEGKEDLPNGKYATGVRFQWAMSYDRGIMIAWKQNGMALAPDHGRPVRVVIPGVIGGRSVKWLKRITIQDTPPAGWYHKYDNRVLPTTVSPEESTTSDFWWSDERFAIYDLNIQSVTVKPEHGFTMAKNAQGNYTLKGFGYNGGGRQITRVELSLDKGKTWVQANIRYLEDELREKVEKGEVDMLYGGKVDICDRYMYFCWCFWEVDIACQDIVKAKDIVVRAMDDSMVVQPRDMYWSVLGMVGNWWYRVAIVGDGDNVRFEHPVNLGKKDGWMDRVLATGRSPADINWGEPMEGQAAAAVAPPKPKKEVKMTNDDVKGVIISKEKFAELAKTRAVFTLRGEVYDATDYLDTHPGGADSIEMLAGEDASEDFFAIHSENAKLLAAKYHIGTLEGSAGAKSDEDEEPAGPTFLNPKKWKKVELMEKQIVSHDTRIFRLKLQTPEQTSGLPVGQHIFIRAKDPATDEYVMRAYTPVSCHLTKGYIDLLVKIYFPRGDIPGGRLGMILENLNIGDKLEVKGPTGHFKYLGNGECDVKGQKLHANMFYMICGGSGITPCYQVMKEMVKDTDNKVKCYLMYGNKEIHDLLCDKDIRKFKEESKGRITSDYWFNVKPENFDGCKIGFITKDYLNSLATKEELQHVMILTCGPPGMVNSIKSWAAEIGIDQSRLVVF